MTIGGYNMGNEHIREFIRRSETALMNENLSCSDILNLKETFYRKYGKMALPEVKYLKFHLFL
jgi:hypothetical protein